MGRSLDFGRLVITGIRGSNPDDPLLRADLDACRQAGVRGVLLFDVDVPSLVDEPADAPRNIHSAEQVRELIGHIRSELGDDAWVAIDQEGGAVARLGPRHGFAAELSAAEFAALDGAGQRAHAEAQASQLASLGFDLNFAPCVDLALNRDSNLLAARGRTFGAEPARVIDSARVVLDAHRAAGVATCLKHFPGHGSSAGDTHLGVVDVTSTWQRDAELAPYVALGDRPGVSVMAAHVMHRDLDADLPASLSRHVIEGLLRGDLGFDGVVVTDSIDMRAISDRFAPGVAAVAAVRAGVDLVVDAFNLLPRAVHPAAEIVQALADSIPRARLHQSLDRIERLRAGLAG